MARPVPLRPRWILGHIVVLCMVALMLGLANWQHNRLEHRKVENRQVAAEMRSGPVQIDSQITLNAQFLNRKVAMSGTWDTSRSVYVRYKLFGDGRPGYWVLVPFKLNNGEVVVVNRGWKSNELAAADSRTKTDDSPTSIEGTVQHDEKPLGTVEQTTGNPPIPTVRSVNATQLTPLIDAGPLAKNYVQLSAPAPTTQNAPQLLPMPEISERSHFAYMLQWIAFSVLVLVGYAILLRKAIIDAREPQQVHE